MYFLMPSSTPNHTIPTVHREDIFLCLNLLSEWAFELCGDAETKTPSDNSSYNLKQLLDFQSLLHNQFLWRTHAAIVTYCGMHTDDKELKK